MTLPVAAELGGRRNSNYCIKECLMRNRFAIKKRTFLRWAVSALFILVVFMGGCGGDNDEIDDWIIPESISGVWVAEFDRVDGLPGADQLEREYRFFVEESDGDVTGSFEALYYDGTHLNFPLVGSYNSGNGILKLNDGAKDSYSLRLQPCSSKS